MPVGHVRINDPKPNPVRNRPVTSPLACLSGVPLLSVDPVKLDTLIAAFLPTDL